MRKNGKTFFTTENANGDEVLNFLCALRIPSRDTACRVSTYWFRTCPG